MSALAAALAVTTISIGARLTAGGGAPAELAPADVADPAPVVTALATSAASPGSLEPRRPGQGSPSRPAPRSRAARAKVAVPAIPEQAHGTFDIAQGESRVVGTGDLVTYTVEVEDGLPLDHREVVKMVDSVLADERGWASVQHRALQRVESDPAFRIRLASPVTADRLCAPLDTGGRLSCRNGENVVLNAWRWVHGAAAYGGDTAAYRRYMINHEFGHALGNGHRSCPNRGAPAPVMLQQTKGLRGCTPNPWPTIP